MLVVTQRSLPGMPHESEKGTCSTCANHLLSSLDHSKHIVRAQQAFAVLRSATQCGGSWRNMLQDSVSGDA